MDPEANRSEQLQMATAIMNLWDEASDDHVEAHFTDEQTTELVQRAYLLAELVLALNEWRMKGGA